MAGTGDYGLPTDPLADPSLPDWAAAVHLAITQLQQAPTAVVGEIRMYGVNTAPTGWLVCDGSSVLRTDYQALFDVIGVTFGAGLGDGLTFTLPNLLDRVPMGGGTLGQLGGQDDVTLSEAHLAAHTHPGDSHNHSVSITTTSDSHTHGLMMRSNNVGAWNGYVVRGPNDGGGSGPYSQAVASDNHNHTVSGNTSTNSSTTGSTGSGDPVPIVPSHQRLTFIIYAG